MIQYHAIFNTVRRLYGAEFEFPEMFLHVTLLVQLCGVIMQNPKQIDDQTIKRCLWLEHYKQRDILICFALFLYTNTRLRVQKRLLCTPSFQRYIHRL